MTEAVATPQKRVLGDASNNPRNVQNSPSSMKKRKLDALSSSKLGPTIQNGQRKVPGSSQPQKSQFEEEVLEKLTQDITDLKGSNSEKDQQWERPPLGPFDPTKDNVCFQQIDAEEGTISGGKTAVRLFGVTEVLFPRRPVILGSNLLDRLVSRSCYTLPDSNIICISPLRWASRKMIATLIELSWKADWGSSPRSSSPFKSQ